MTVCSLLETTVHTFITDTTAGGRDAVLPLGAPTSISGSVTNAVARTMHRQL